MYRDTIGYRREKRKREKEGGPSEEAREITGILPGGRRHVVSAGTRLPTLHHEFLVHAGRNQPILKARPVVVPRARGALPSTDYRLSISVSSAQQDLTSSWRVIPDDDRTPGLARSRSMTPIVNRRVNFETVGGK